MAFPRDRSPLSPSVVDLIAAVLAHGDEARTPYFSHRRLGLVYRAYVISQVLDPLRSTQDPYVAAGEVPGDRAARILGSFGLTGPGSQEWVQLYEHIGGVVAASVTIARRAGLSPSLLSKVRSASLLHDATKRRDVERYGPLANSAANVDHSLEDAMRAAGYSEDTITAAMNTSRAERIFPSQRDRLQNIIGKGIVAAIVALADARNIGAHFCSLRQAQFHYLTSKHDPESQEFFTKHWRIYYETVEDYLQAQAPSLDLRISPEDIYNETVFTEVFGPRASEAVRKLYFFTRPDQ
jgi:hypothetical protein